MKSTNQPAQDPATVQNANPAHNREGFARKHRPTLLALAVLVSVVVLGGWFVLRSRLVLPWSGKMTLQVDAMSQFEYARTRFFEPGFRAHGDRRQFLLSRAIEALTMVVTRFPQPLSCTTRALAEYDTGLCYCALGEVHRGRNAFLRVVDDRRYTVSGSRMPAAGKDTLRTLIAAAQAQIRQLKGQ